MPNVCTFRGSLIRGYLPDLMPLVSLFHPWSRKSPPSWLPWVSVDNSCGSHLPVWDVGYLMFSLSLSLSPLLALFVPLILYPVVLRTPSRITKTNSSLVVSCNLRKTRATISEHGTNSIAVSLHTLHCRGRIFNSSLSRLQTNSP